MELQLVKSLEFSKRTRKWVLIIAAAGVTSYGAYRVYRIPAIARKRKRLVKLLKALISVVEAVSDSAETIAIVSKDLKEFLQSDSDQLPSSLRQISKITRSQEFCESLIRVTEALTIGILRGFNIQNGEEPISSGFPDRLLDKLFSTAGSGFASVVVGSFARSLVMAFYSNNRTTSSSTNANSVVQMGVSRPGSVRNSVPSWVNMVCSGKCTELIADCIQLFVSTAVAAYLEKTIDINTYDEIFSGLTNPKHEAKVKDMLVSVCNGAVETLVKTSHQVLTNSSSLTDKGKGPSSNAGEVCDQGDSLSNSHDWSSHNRPLNTKMVLRNLEELSVDNRARSSFDEIQHGGWVDKVSCTLKVPSNRRFLLDVTGRVTFETVRSFLDFLLWQLSDGLKRCFHVFPREAVEKGLEVIRYAGAKSVVIVAICLALCLHVLVGTRFLTAA